MSENPYQSPHEAGDLQTDDLAAPAIASTKAPAICLMVVSIISLLFFVFGFVIAVFVVANFGAIMDDGPQEVADHENFVAFRKIITSGLMFIANIVTLCACINMLNYRNYQFCMIGSILACIPCCGPCYVLGIPFGIWCLQTLNKEEIKARFAANEKRITDSDAESPN